MNREMLAKILACPQLPTFPAVAVEILEASRQPELDLQRIIRAISADAALSAKLMRTVNSSLYRVSTPIATINQAVVMLGLGTVTIVALSFSVVKSFGAGSLRNGFNATAFWARSIYAAAGARVIARSAALDSEEEAFLDGLLQDLGVLAMLQALGPDYLVMLGSVDHATLRIVEQERFGIDHPTVGAELATRWQLPPILIEPIRFHEEPSLASLRFRGLVRAVSLGSKAADVLLTSTQAREEAFIKSAQESFDFNPDAARKLLTNIDIAGREVVGLFDLDLAGVNSQRRNGS